MILSDFLGYFPPPPRESRGELKIFNFYLLLISYYFISSSIVWPRISGQNTARSNYAISFRSNVINKILSKGISGQVVSNQLEIYE